LDEIELQVQIMAFQTQAGIMLKKMADDNKWRITWLISLSRSLCRAFMWRI